MTAVNLPAPALQPAHAAPPTPAATTAVRDRWRMGAEARGLVLIVMILQAFGLAVLYSASAMTAIQEGHPGTYYLLRQLSGVLMSVVCFAVAAKVDAERWREWAWPLVAFTAVLLLIPVLPGTEAISPRLNGSRRWISIGMSFQPSELAKMSVVIWTAMLLVKKGDQMRRLTKGLLPFLVIVGALALLIALEPDLSQGMMLFLVMGIVLFAGGVRIGHFVALGVLAIPVIWHELERLQYALLRMVAFLNPGGAPEQVNYQMQQSLIAVGSGGWFGVGFGEGRQQFGFLPYPYSDFIGGNVGEEFGFLGLLVVVALFTTYCVLGFRIAKLARSPFQRLVAVGLTATTVITAFLHLGVVIGLFPTTGLTLPFFSFGRSNLLVTYLMTGLLVNIGSSRERVFGEGATDPMAVR